jgi:putative PIN family toxin of toxin-antitoxin system
LARVVVDTNIIFSALINGAESVFAETLLRSDNEFFVCESMIVEIFKHKEKLTKFSRISEDDMTRWYHLLLKNLHLYKEDLIAPENRKAAYRLCRDIDETDTPHVALAMELKAALWTGDKKLQNGLKAKGFTEFFVPTVPR